MRRVFIALLMSVIHVKFNTLCPVRSCVICSEDVIICHRLSNIIEVPETLKALMLTDGLITSVDNRTLSDLSNMTMLGLSNNIISDIMENAFHNLTVLRILLLDHNHMTSISIPDSAFIQLQNLEILQLGHNAIQYVKGHWFQNMSNLLTLQLEGNRITRLPSGTFKSANLDKLENLDLSDNLIEFLDKGSFRSLPRLQRLDLSRNSLHSAPDAFSHLSRLSALNLDMNQWDCTCELRELALFLRGYAQSQDRQIDNSPQLVCVSTANPVVQTVLQLAEISCAVPKRSTSVLIRSSNSPDLYNYARDIALTAFFFFVGGVGLTVGIHYIIYKKLGPNRNLKLSKGRSCFEEEAVSRGAIIHSQGTPWCNFTKDRNVEILTITHPRREAKLRLPNQEQRSDFQGQNHYQGSKAMHHMLNNQRVQRDILYQQRNPGERAEDKLPQGCFRHISANHRQNPTMTPWNTERTTNGSYRDFGDSDFMSKIQSESALPECLTVSCMQCQKASEYRLAVIQGRNGTEESHTNSTEHLYITERLSNLKTKLYRESTFNGTHGEHPLKRLGVHSQQQRNVTFNLTEQEFHFSVAPKKMRPYTTDSDGENACNERSTKQKRWDRKKRRNLKHSLMKVKINLNPVKKSRVHPKDKMERLPWQNDPDGTRKSRKTRGNKEASLDDSRKKVENKEQEGAADEDVLNQAQQADKSQNLSPQEVISPSLKDKLTQLHDAVLETIKECVNSQPQETEDLQSKDALQDDEKQEHRTEIDNTTKECQTDFEKEEKTAVVGVHPEDPNKTRLSEDISQDGSNTEDAVNREVERFAEPVVVPGEAQAEQSGDVQTSEAPSQEGNLDTASNQETEESATLNPPGSTNSTPPAQTPTNTQSMPAGNIDPVPTQAGKKQKQGPSKQASQKKKPQSAGQKKTR